jgi:Na+-driven multidrug efflux pump
LYIGIPSSIENGLFHLGRVLVVSIISGFGTVQIAANGVANSLDSIGCIMGMAMNLAMITVIGQCVGADDKEQIKYYMKKLLVITYVGFAVINIPLLLGLDKVLMLYGLGAETTKLASTLVMIHNGAGMLLWPMAFVFPYMLRACNDVRFPMVASILSMCVFRIGFSLILGVHFGMGAIGVWIAMVIDWVFRCICFGIRYFRGTWKKQAFV